MKKPENAIKVRSCVDCPFFDEDYEECDCEDMKGTAHKCCLVDVDAFALPAKCPLREASVVIEIADGVA